MSKETLHLIEPRIPAVQRELVDQVLRDYDVLEPGDEDSWNPLGSKYQLGYRLNQFYALTQALRRCGPHVRDLRVLDLGCGNGRSCRMYLDLGLKPDQVTGNDLRKGTIDLARSLNPAITWKVYDGGAIEPGYNWISTCVVFSSVTNLESRNQIAARIWDTLPSGGFMFYFDFHRAVNFAGGDAMNPLETFLRDFDVVYAKKFGRFTTFPIRDRVKGVVRTACRGDNLNPTLKEAISDYVAPSHLALLLRKP